MAYLILENSETQREGTGGYFDFDPQNGNELTSIQNILAARRSDNHAVTLLSASGEDAGNGLGRLLSTVMSLFSKESEGKKINTLSRTPKYCLNPQNCHRLHRSTTDLSVA